MTGAERAVPGPEPAAAVPAPAPPTTRAGGTGALRGASSFQSALRAGRPRAPDRAEAQARYASAQLAAGTPAGLPAAAPASAGTEGGRALPETLRATFERAVGVDLSTIRIHADPAAGAAVSRVHANAITVGEDIAIAPGLYRPDDARGRTLLAHEVAHVVQQRSAGVRPQYEVASVSAPAEATGPPEEPVWLTVSINGLRFTSPDLVMPVGEPATAAYLRVAIRRLAPTASTEDTDAVIAALPQGGTLAYTGSVSLGRQIGADERFAPLTIQPGATATLLGLLRERHVEIDLTPVQLRLLEIGEFARRWEGQGITVLQADFPWYNRTIWLAQLTMHAGLLDRAVTAQRAEPEGAAATPGLDLLLAQFRRPLEVVHATHADPALQRPPTGDPTTTEGRHALNVQVAWTLLWGTVRTRGSSVDERRIKAIEFYWSAPGLYDAGRTEPAGRRDFLLRFYNWLERAAEVAEPRGNRTQELIADPGRFTDPPFPARLQAVPEGTGDLRVVPAHAEHRYRFSVDFRDVFDALGRYAYRWDILAWPVAGRDTAGAIREIESGTSDAGRRRGGRSVSHADVLAARLRRDVAHAQADVVELAEALGPSGITMSPALAALFELRGLSTVVRTFVDIVTLENGPGVRERMIQLPRPGLWVVRAAAVPQFEASDEVHRAPSVAYIPVFAIPQQELATGGLTSSIEAAETAERSRVEAVAALREMAGPGGDPALWAAAAELAADPRLGTDRWAALQAQQLDLERTLREVRAELAGTAAATLSPPELAALRSQETALAAQVERNAELLRTHGSRVERRPALAHAQPLMATLATDEGATIPLSLEWVEQPREEASLESVLAAGGRRARFAVVSDHTGPHSGLDEGVGGTVDLAVKNALTALLRGRFGYGRGLVAVRLPSGRRDTIRIEASLGSILNEALDDATTLVTVAALAAAPFTGGASLTILVPVGIVAGVRAGERMYARYDASTLRWDMATFQDLLDVAGAAVGLGAVARGTRAGLQATRIGRLAAVSFEISQNVTGYIILGAQLEEQLRAIDATPGISEGERRSRRAIAVGQALLGAGMTSASILIPHAYAPRPSAPPAEGRTPRPVPAPEAPRPAPRPRHPDPHPRPRHPDPSPRRNLQPPPRNPQPPAPNRPHPRPRSPTRPPNRPHPRPRSPTRPRRHRRPASTT